MAEMSADVANNHTALFSPKDDCRFQVRQIQPDSAGLELEHIAFDAEYRHAAEKKYHHFIIKAHQLSAPGANILKQTCLSLGTDAGVHRGAINCTIDREAVLITATEAQLERLILKLRPQPFGLKPLAESISRMLQRQRKLGQKPLQVMAILNITPDSFSDGGQLTTIDSVLVAAEKALTLGATYLDVGGESTRPGAESISVETECERILPVITALHQRFPQAPISVDTRKAAVAEAALDVGATMINDVSGGMFDPEMFPLVAKMGCDYVLMHSQGTPETMQANPTYENNDVVGAVSELFYQQIAAAMAHGVRPEQITLDPGFGFGKTRQHNLTLLQRLPELISIGFPLLVGTSRKTFLAPDLSPSQREAVTAASLAIAIQSGARILRLHDVEAQMPVVRFLQDLTNQTS